MNDLAQRNALVEANLGLATTQAKRAKLQVPESIQVEDLVQTGRMALITEAARYLAMKWDARGAPPFDAFARRRVYGSMIDSCRRRHYRNAKYVSLDVPLKMKLGVNETGGTRNARARDYGSIQATIPDHDARIDAERKRQALGQVVQMLDPRARKVVELRATLNNRQAGAALGLARDRVSQIHRVALITLRRGLRARGLDKAA
jgi:RNA polymerase sigma factor (sigma-70 family)